MRSAYVRTEYKRMHSGLACLCILNDYYKKAANSCSLEEAQAFGAECSSIARLSQIAENMKYRARVVSMTFEQLCRDASLPCILQLKNNNYVLVLRDFSRAFAKTVRYLDPVAGMVAISKDEFRAVWANLSQEGDGDHGLLLLLEPMPTYAGRSTLGKPVLSWSVIFRYLERSRVHLIKVAICLLVASFLQFIFPFLTQSIVDVGIETRDLNYITILLVGQLMLVFSRAVADFVRNHLVLYVSTIFSLSLVSDFWIKLTRLPIEYFEEGRSGEMLQRITDNKQLQTFMTGSALQTLYAGVNFVVFAFILVTYGGVFFFVYTIGILFYFAWMMSFLKMRKKINYQLFHSYSRENNATLQLIQGMQEIKLLNIEQSKRWEWESVQSEIFKLNYKNLSYGQIQQSGSMLINQIKDVVLIFVAAAQVIEGQLTFGSLLAIQYIVGQMNGPIDQFIRFIQDAQNAKNSVDRLNEVHRLEDEYRRPEGQAADVSIAGDIRIRDLSFGYPGQSESDVLKDISLDIPEGKTTAILGTSGSGKTTLMKILLKFYSSYQGDIRVGGEDLRTMDPVVWRRHTAAVLSEGFVFNDTIEKNIAVEYGPPDREKLYDACRAANILQFIESLPDGFKTPLGVGGVGISQGQKQRIFIARAIYKDARYIFFDESTNALDVNTERTIVENLKEVFAGKTVLIIAHRLSTIRDADKIVVFNGGGIAEEGTHMELSIRKGKYSELVKNQYA